VFLFALLDKDALDVQVRPEPENIVLRYSID